MSELVMCAMLESMRFAGHLRREDNVRQEMCQLSETTAGNASIMSSAWMVCLVMGQVEMALLTLLNEAEELIVLRVSAKLSVGEEEGMVCVLIDMEDDGWDEVVGAIVGCMGQVEMALLTLLNEMEELILLNVSAKLSVGEDEGMECVLMDMEDEGWEEVVGIIVGCMTGRNFQAEGMETMVGGFQERLKRLDQMKYDERRAIIEALFLMYFFCLGGKPSLVNMKLKLLLIKPSAPISNVKS